MTDMVNHPPHYRGHPSGIECIDITRHLTFDVGNAVKYVWRAEAKNGREDLEKARWYLRDAIEHSNTGFATATPWQLAARLSVVSRHETDPLRKAFFKMIEYQRMDDALEAVNAMLDAD